MSTNQANNWQQKERGSPLGMRLLIRFALLAGRAAARLVLYPVVAFFWLFGRNARESSREFLQIALQRAITWRDTYRHLFYFAATILDRVYLLAGRSRYFDVEIHRHRCFADYSGEHSGLFIVSHCGSFEIMRALGKERRQFKIKFLMDNRHGAQLAQLLNEVNPDFLEHIIDVGDDDVDMMLRVRAAIQDGYMVGVMADRLTERDTPVICDFMGRPAAFPLSPWLLAALLQVPTRLCFGLYHGGNQYRIHFEPLEVPPVQRRKRREMAEAYAQAYAGRLEYYARLAPYNWFNFYSFWEHKMLPHTDEGGIDGA